MCPVESELTSVDVDNIVLGMAGRVCLNPPALLSDGFLRVDKVKVSFAPLSNLKSTFSDKNTMSFLKSASFVLKVQVNRGV